MVGLGMDVLRQMPDVVTQSCGLRGSEKLSDSPIVMVELDSIED